MMINQKNIDALNCLSLNDFQQKTFFINFLTHLNHLTLLILKIAALYFVEKQRVLLFAVWRKKKKLNSYKWICNWKTALTVNFTDQTSAIMGLDFNH